jgi:DNA polymerase III subunit epsilon
VTLRHMLSRQPNGGYWCSICHGSWASVPESNECVEHYSWDDWPEHLRTEKQMSEAGFRGGKYLPPVVGVISNRKSPDGWLRLYDPEHGTPKIARTEKQKAAAQKAKELWQCAQCGKHLRFKNKTGNAHCSNCRKKEADQQARKVAILWAREKLNGEFVILNCETTGAGSTAEPVQIAVINQAGETLFNSLIKPSIPIPADTIHLHHITDEMVASSPSFGDVYPILSSVLIDLPVLIYDADHINGVLRYNCQLHNVLSFGLKTESVMRKYSAFVGEPWEDEGLGRSGYKPQPLGGNHDALDDCHAILDRVHEMAESPIEATDNGI